MKNRWLCGNIFPVLGLVFALSPLGHAAVSSRIASVATEARRPLQHTVSPRVNSAVDLGAAPAALKLDELSLQFNMTGAQRAELSQLLADQQNPASPSYHKWLTSEQFGAQFGLSAGDIAKVSSWLTGQGFAVTRIANSSTFITFSGTAAQVQKAFGTTIHSVSVGGERHIANLSEPTLPTAIANVVANIAGLNDFRPKSHPSIRQIPAGALRPHFTAPFDSTYHALAPADFNTIYDVNPLLGNGDGAGIGKCSAKPAGMCGDIAVLGQVDLDSNALSDISAFRTAAGLDPAHLPTQLLVGTDPGTPTGCNTATPPAGCSDLQEASLDTEWAGAIAPSANILFVTSNNVITTSLVQAVDLDVAPIISISYGQCESSISGNALLVLTITLQQATSQGMTVIGPTGDDGATDCDTHVASATHGLAVDFPGSSPSVTGLGGTMFNDNSGSWGATNGPGGASATGYIPEVVWNETAQNLAKPGPPTFGSGGGGSSVVFAKPVWQRGQGVPPVATDPGRDVPDISLNAASLHDGYLVCIQGSCTAGTFYNTTSSGTSIYAFGGTSVAAPAFAGVMALVEQSLNQQDPTIGRLGNINPNIYAMANSSQYHSIFHDITSGDNKSPCTAGTTDCQNGGLIGYTAGPNYDQASGWGSIDAANFVSEWISPLVNSLTTVTATPLSTTAGTAISLAITVAPNGYSTRTPTGTAQIFLDGATVPSSSVTLSGSTASYSLDTTGLAVGSHGVTVIYSGDSNFTGSQGTTTFTITVPSAPVASTTTVTATPSSVAAGSPVTLAVAVAPSGTGTGTPTGTVQISVDGAAVTSLTLSGGRGSYSLSTTGLASGSHTVTATYTGDANFNGSQGTTTFTVTGGTTTPIASVTTVTATPASGTAGTPISLAVTVAPSGTATGTPTGSVQILLDGTTVGSATLSGGHASYSLSTAGLISGSHTVTAAYSGDSNFNPSQGTTTINIAAVVGADFTITPGTASIYTIAGDPIPKIVLTLTPLNGFTGTIALSTSDLAKNGFAAAFSANPVVLNSTAGASTVLQLSALPPSALARNHPPAGKLGWYLTGSGATLACMFLFAVPRRRRWGALLAVLLSVGAIGASGCGSGGIAPVTQTYNITVTATAAGNIAHTTVVKWTVK